MERQFDGKIVTQSDYPWAKSSWLCLIQVAATTKAQFLKAKGTGVFDEDGEVIFQKLYRSLNISEAYSRSCGYRNIMKALEWNNLSPIYHCKLKRWVSIIGLLKDHELRKMVVFIDHVDGGKIKDDKLNFHNFNRMIHLSTVNEYFRNKHRIKILSKFIEDNHERFHPTDSNP